MTDKNVQLGADVQLAAGIGNYLANAQNPILALGTKNHRFAKVPELFDALLKELETQCDNAMEEINKNK